MVVLVDYVPEQLERRGDGGYLFLRLTGKPMERHESHSRNGDEGEQSSHCDLLASAGGSTGLGPL